MKLEWAHLVDASIPYFNGGDKIFTDVANALAIENLGITGLTPTNTPSVLDNPVHNGSVGTWVLTVSNDKKCVIEEG